MKSVVITASVAGAALALASLPANALDLQDCLDNPTCVMAKSNMLAYNSNYRKRYSYRNRSNYRSRYKARRSYSTYRRKNFPSRIRAPGQRLFVFSPRYKMWAAYNAQGHRVRTGVANGGSNWCADMGRPCRTPVGSFRIQRKGSASCKSSKYPRPSGGAPMPYCMFFKTNYAIHGSPYISNRNGSHGCIRVKTGAAAWLHSEFLMPGTKVMVLPY